MLTLADYQGLDTLSLSKGLRNREFTSLELVDTAAALVEEFNPQLNAIVSLDLQRARDSAREISVASEDSLFRGVPFLIKDLSALAGMPQGMGSRAFNGYSPQQNSALVQRFVDAGLVMLGKTNTPENGLTLTTEPVSAGACRNPWNTAYSTGGSSGGAAAAVAAGIVPCAHASDGGGSIRIPASCCGLFGLKPSRGLTVIDESLTANWSGMSVGLVVSRTVRDTAAYLKLCSLSRPGQFPLPAIDQAVEPGQPHAEKLRVAFMENHPFGLTVDGSCRATANRAAELCMNRGHQVEPVAALPVDMRACVKSINVLVSLHTYQVFSRRARESGTAMEELPLESSTLAMAKAGAAITGDHYVEARDQLRLAELEIAAFFKEFDCLLSPVLAMPTAQLGWLDMNSTDLAEYGRRYREYSGFTAIMNGLGLPSMSVPIQADPAGLPVGAMFSAGWGRDQLLLTLAAQLEQQNPWPRIAPDFQK